MTDGEIKDALKEWVKDYCRNNFLIKNPDYDPDDPQSEEYIENLPKAVDLFLNQGVDFIKKQSGIQSESLGDHSITFTTDFPTSLMKLIAPYRSMFPVRKNAREWRVIK